MKFLDVHGFAGGFALGARQAGLELGAKFSREVGFGVLNSLANRQLLGEKWESIPGKPEAWDSESAEIVLGNPPCSGFSTLSSKAFRGTDSSINEYMWELIRYAGRVKPLIVMFESVQQTFTQGLPLMRQLFTTLRNTTGLNYQLYHVLHNNASVGGVSLRKRYFWVASLVPFGVEHHTRVTRDGQITGLKDIPTFGDMLKDLAPLGMSMSNQPYRGTIHNDGEPVRIMNSSDWCRREVHDGTGFVDGHQRLHSKNIERALEFIEAPDNPAGVPWAIGENTAAVAQRYYLKNGKLPASWQYQTTGGVTKEQRLVETDWAMGHNQLARWSDKKLARVITGGACHLVLHPWFDRTLTQREAARIQGFPDDWKIWPVRTAPDLGPGWGKGVPVQAGRWVSAWAREALLGNPGPVRGELVAKAHKQAFKRHGSFDNELVIDVTNDWKVHVRPDHGDYGK